MIRGSAGEAGRFAVAPWSLSVMIGHPQICRLVVTAARDSVWAEPSDEVPTFSQKNEQAHETLGGKRCSDVRYSVHARN